jgi:hypothetical protein
MPPFAIPSDLNAAASWLLRDLAQPAPHSALRLR